MIRLLARSHDFAEASSLTPSPCQTTMGGPASAMRDSVVSSAPPHAGQPLRPGLAPGALSKGDEIVSVAPPARPRGTHGRRHGHRACPEHVGGAGGVVPDSTAKVVTDVGLASEKKSRRAMPSEALAEQSPKSPLQDETGLAKLLPCSRPLQFRDELSQEKQVKGDAPTPYLDGRVSLRAPASARWPPPPCDCATATCEGRSRRGA